MTDPIETLARRAAAWNVESRAVLDREPWLLLLASASLATGLDSAAIAADSDLGRLAAVSVALRGRPDVVAEALRLLDAFEVRCAEAAREQQERARAEHVRLFAPALRKVIADLRAQGDAAHLAWEVDYPSRRWPPHSWRLVCGGWSFLEAARGRVPVQRLARAALGGKLIRWSLRRAECLDLLAERMCETRRLSCAQVAAALWLQLQRLELTAERAADLLEAERLRRA